MLRTFHKFPLGALLILFIITSNPAWALDWHDREWTGLGCPSKLSGDWIPLTNSSYTGSMIEFEANGAALSSKENNDIVHTFVQQSKDRQYLFLKRVSEDPTPFPKYLKIRPHIAVQDISNGRKTTRCKIKVFLFESKQKADQMSYLSWDIYNRKQ